MLGKPEDCISIAIMWSLLRNIPLFLMQLNATKFPVNLFLFLLET